jgi:hypothetical protein
MTTPVYVILRYEEEPVLPIQQIANAEARLAMHVAFSDPTVAYNRAQAAAARDIQDWFDDDLDEEGRFGITTIDRSYCVEARTHTGLVITDDGVPCERWEVVQLNQE